MITIPRERTISVDELRRNFGEIKKELPYITFIITDRGKPIGTLSATREMKREMIKKAAGAWREIELEDDKLWNKVLKKHSRKSDVRL